MSIGLKEVEESFKNPEPCGDVSEHEKPVLGQGESQSLTTGNFTYSLDELAFARSGDKGNHCNIGLYSLISVKKTFMSR